MAHNNIKSLRREIEPMAIFLYPNYIRVISVRILPGDVGKTLNFIQQKWEDAFPGELFEFSFLDSRINELYKNEKKMQNIFVTSRTMKAAWANPADSLRYE